MISGDESEMRGAAVAAVRKLDALVMNRGSTGNLSLRQGEGMLITPTGMGADDLRAEDSVWLGWDGKLEGAWQPSSDWHCHQAIYQARPDPDAIVHTQPMRVAARARLRRRLPAFHCTQAVAGAMHDRDACLMANHGLVAAGATLARAMKVAQEIESLCEVYLKALAVSEPAVLTRAQMDEVIERSRGYGKAATRQ